MKEKNEKKAQSKVMSLMGFAARARKIVCGYNTVRTTIERRKAKLVIIAEDISDNSKEKMKGIASGYGARLIEYGNSDEMSHITGNEGKGIFALTDKQFAEAIAKAIEKETENN